MFSVDTFRISLLASPLYPTAKTSKVPLKIACFSGKHALTIGVVIVTIDQPSEADFFKDRVYLLLFAHSFSPDKDNLG